MKDYHRLLRFLESEISMQEQLLELLTRERAAIIAVEQEKIQALAEEKERLIGRCQQLGAKRTEFLLNETGVSDQKEIKLRNLVAECPEGQVRQLLSKSLDELSQTAETVAELNRHNGSMIKQSLGLLATTFSILRSAPGVDSPTYSSKGSLKEGEKEGFVRRGPSITRSA